jgi:hypothetical protein
MVGPGFESALENGYLQPNPAASSFCMVWGQFTVLLAANCDSELKSRLGNIVSGAFTPVLAKHWQNFSIVDSRQSAWTGSSATSIRSASRSSPGARSRSPTNKQSSSSTERSSKVTLAFLAPLPDVHRNYFEPTHSDFAPRTMWSLSNAFTSALKSLDPIPFFQATATLGTFLQSNN